MDINLTLLQADPMTAPVPSGTLAIAAHGMTVGDAGEPEVAYANGPIAFRYLQEADLNLSTPLTGLPKVFVVDHDDSKALDSDELLSQVIAQLSGD